MKKKKKNPKNNWKPNPKVVWRRRTNMNDGWEIFYDINHMFVCLWIWHYWLFWWMYFQWNWKMWLSLNCCKVARWAHICNLCWDFGLRQFCVLFNNITSLTSMVWLLNSKLLMNNTTMHPLQHKIINNNNIKTKQSILMQQHHILKQSTSCNKKLAHHPMFVSQPSK
jgi:hypothetical protein